MNGVITFMGKQVYLKSTIRQVAFTLFLLLLLGFISFTFISSAVQYIIVKQETDRLGAYYRSIGALTPIEPNERDVTAGADLIAKSPYLGFEDRRRVCSAVMDGIFNADTDGNVIGDDIWSTYTGGVLVDTQYPLGLYLTDIYVYGILTDLWVNHYVDHPEWDVYRLRMTVDRVEEGYPDYVKEGDVIWISFPWFGEEVGEAAVGGMEVGKRYFIKAYKSPSDINRALGPTNMANNISSTMRPLALTDDKGWYMPVDEEESAGSDAPDVVFMKGEGWYLPVEAGESIDFDTPEMAMIKADLEVLRENHRAMQVITTRDMSAMPRMQEVRLDHYLREGRWLNNEDDINANRVCVVHHRFADKRGLTVGDTVKLKFRDLQAKYDGYILKGNEWMDEHDPDFYDACKQDWDNWRDYPTYEEEFTIVGIYGMRGRSASATKHSNYMYIPDSCLREGYGIDTSARIDSNNYSFVLDSSRNQDDFIRETTDALAELGFDVSFVESDSASFWGSADPIIRSAAASAMMFAAVLFVALALATFLYIRQRRREFAILRALGVPKRVAVRKLFAPIALVGLLGISAGGVPSWEYALKKAAEVLSTLQVMEGTEVNVTLAPTWLGVLCAGVFVLLLLFVWFGALLVSRRPALELLQGVQTKAKGSKKTKKQSLKRQKPETEAPPPLSLPDKLVISIPTPTDNNSKGIVASTRYVMRHAHRSAFKSILAMIVALGFVLALGWMAWTIERSEAEIDRLYDTTVVKAEIRQRDPDTNPVIYPPDGGTGIAVGDDIITKKTVDKILGSEFVQDSYLEAGSLWWEPAAVRAFDRPEVFFEDAGRYAEVEYADGWDSEIFSEVWTKERIEEESVPVVMPLEIIEGRGISLGDVTKLVYSDYYTGFSFNRDRRRVTLEVIVVGQYTGIKDDPIFAPLSAVEARMGDNMRYSVAEFYIDPAKNRELPLFIDETQAMVNSVNAGVVRLHIKFWDEELRQAIAPMERNVQIFSVLYPVMIAVSALIAAGLAVLLMLQSAREAALMRVLGTTKRRARLMLCGSYVVVCVIGLLLGLAALAFVRGDVIVLFAPYSLMCAGIYLAGALLGSGIASIAVTNRMPLELLQVKE